ncbi:MAG TPA: DUF5987 family protein [Kutzneria sp.]|jgi:hypothetical protein
MSLTDEQTMTLEAYADTIIPGEKRGPDDRAIAGVAAGGGAVAAGALDILQTEAGGLAGVLGDLAGVLDKHVLAYAEEHGLELDPTVPPFVALSYEHRVGVVSMLCRPGHPEKQMWVNLAMFSNMAFDTGAHMSTAKAFETGHPGLLHLGFRRPDADGLWRFSEYSYRRQLASPHPATTPSGSPA